MNSPQPQTSAATLDGHEETRPLVSILVPTLNEAAYIDSTISSLLAQSTPDFDLELLVIDGKSSDSTAEIVRHRAASDPRVRLIANPRRQTPVAFNLGLQAARGEYVCILGAHSTYAPDYISVCFDELRAHGAVGCSGRVITRPTKNTGQSRLVAWVLAHPFGSSGSSVRLQAEGFVDTIPFPLMRKDVLLQVGGYDEQLHRNQDNDMNQKLRDRGWKLYLTHKTHADYFVKATIRSLFSYAFHNGFWNYLSLRRHPSSMRLRHFVPFVFVLALVGSMVLALGAPLFDPPWRTLLCSPLVLVLASHLLVGLASAFQVAFREKSAGALLMPFIFLGFHCAYGAGTLAALVRNARLPPPPHTIAQGQGTQA